MKKIDQIINNYINGKDAYALQIDGEWGTGKTYYIKNHVMKELDDNMQYLIYFSIYGYNSLNELKQEIFYKIISVLSINETNLKILTGLKKRIRDFSKIVDNEKIKSINLIGDWILESYNKSKLKLSNTDHPIVIFLDDLERLSKNVDTTDFLGFVLNELLEKLGCRVIILSNTSEIKDSEEFKKIREKVISRTVKFSYEMSTIEEDILKKSDISFIKKHSSWVRNILESFQNTSNKSGLNLRTLLSIMTNYDFVETHLINDINNLESEDLREKIRKSIFLNIFVITHEYKLGNITDDNFELLNRLVTTRFFSNYLIENERPESIENMIIDRYHHKTKEFDDYIYYSSEINSYIISGFFEQNSYVREWKASFIKSGKKSNVEKLNNFRRLTDHQLQGIQEDIFKGVENDRLDFKELVKVYGLLDQFKKMNLNFLDNNYEKIIESKLVGSYRFTAEKEKIDVIDEFYRVGFPNIKEDRPKLYNSLLELNNQVETNKVVSFLEDLFNGRTAELESIKQEGFLLQNNIFSTMLEKNSNLIEQYIVTNNNSADFLWQLIRSEYLRVSNAKEYHGEEIEDIKLFKQEVEDKMNYTELGKIDDFKINQLIEVLDSLLDHLK